jgi:hypothetical protein
MIRASEKQKIWKGALPKQQDQGLQRLARREENTAMHEMAVCELGNRDSVSGKFSGKKSTKILKVS